jgi:hypothetical protein
MTRLTLKGAFMAVTRKSRRRDEIARSKRFQAVTFDRELCRT